MNALEMVAVFLLLVSMPLVIHLGAIGGISFHPESNRRNYLANSAIETYIYAIILVNGILLASIYICYVIGKTGVFYLLLVISLPFFVAHIMYIINAVYLYISRSR